MFRRKRFSRSISSQGASWNAWLLPLSCTFVQLFPAMRTRIIDEGFGPYWHLCRRIWIETPGENSCDAYRCGWFLRSWLCMRVALGRRRRLLRHLQRRSASALCLALRMCELERRRVLRPA